MCGKLNQGPQHQTKGHERRSQSQQARYQRKRESIADWSEDNTDHRRSGGAEAVTSVSMLPSQVMLPPWSTVWRMEAAAKAKSSIELERSVSKTSSSTKVSPAARQPCLSVAVLLEHTSEHRGRHVETE